MIATCSADDAADVLALSPETIEIDKTASHLESANRCVVLVLHNDRGSEALGEKRPSILWCRWHDRAHDGDRPVELIECEHRPPL